MRHVAETTGQDLEQLYGQIGWPLYKLYGHAFEAFKQMVQDPEPIFARLQVLSSLCTSTENAINLYNSMQIVVGLFVFAQGPVERLWRWAVHTAASRMPDVLV